jgi:hypothetical protein
MSSTGVIETGAGDSTTTADLELLRSYEPVIRYTEGELFFPSAVGPYTAQCSLWAGTAEGESELIVPHGELTLGRLGEQGRLDQERPLYMQFVAEPFGRRAYRRWRRSLSRRLRTGGRLTTTGLLGRLVDAGFRASLLLRGKVPAGVTAAAHTLYREHLDAERFTYYGRVVRDGGYVCLQYWFFYAMNDWRSTFHGLNDHEADWELVTIYLAERLGEPGQPVWAASSAHDYEGDDLRRRWDDPALIREGDHVVVFAGAGSHAGTFIPGDYVVRVDPPQLRAVISVVRRLTRLVVWRRSTAQPIGLGIPFVDYARGDGVAIGPGHDATWIPILIDDETPWVHDYRGLWGLDTRDRFGGERAPAGPRYRRDGSVRTAWANPVGWAGLLKVPPRPDDIPVLLAERVAVLDAELKELDETIASERAALRRLRVEARSLEMHSPSRFDAITRLAEVAERETALNETIANRTRLTEERTAHLATLSRPPTQEPPQAHINRLQVPLSERHDARRWILKLWAKFSIPLLLGCIVLALLAPPLALVTTLAVIAAAFTGVEALAHRRLLALLVNLFFVVVALAFMGALVLLFLEHWRWAVSVVIGLAALVLLVGNLMRG